MDIGALLSTDGLWRNALAMIPLALAASFVCRFFLSRPATRHTLWLIVLLTFIVPPFLPRLPRPDVTSLVATAADLVADNRARSKSLFQSRAREEAVEFRVQQPRLRRAARPHGRGSVRLHQTPDLVGQWSPEEAGGELALLSSPRHVQMSGPSPRPLRSPLQQKRPAFTQSDLSDDESHLYADSMHLDAPVLSAHLDAPQVGSVVLDAPASGASRGTFKDTIRPWVTGLAGVRDAIVSLPQIPTLVWLGGSLVLLLSSGAQVLRFRRLIRLARAASAGASMRGSSLQSAVEQMVAEAANRLKLKRVPEVLMVDACISPLIWCGRRPRLIIPLGLWAQLDQTGRRAVIFHELAHLHRRDHWVCWVETLIGCLYWWHPVVWWIRNRLQDEADLCCDAWVTWLMPRGRRAYAEALLKVKRYTSIGSVAVPAMGLGVTKGQTRYFARRLTMVMTKRVRPRLSAPGITLVLAFAAAGWVATPVQSCPDESSKSKPCQAPAPPAADVAVLTAHPAPPAPPARPVILVGSPVGPIPPLAPLAPVLPVPAVGAVVVPGSAPEALTTFEVFVRGQKKGGTVIGGGCGSPDCCGKARKAASVTPGCDQKCKNCRKSGKRRDRREVAAKGCDKGCCGSTCGKGCCATAGAGAGGQWFAFAGPCAKCGQDCGHFGSKAGLFGRNLDQLKYSFAWVEDNLDATRGKLGKSRDKIEKRARKQARRLERRAARHARRAERAPRSKAHERHRAHARHSHSDAKVHEDHHADHPRANEVITRLYRLPEGKLKALVGLMVRSDIPVLVRPTDKGIEVRGTRAQQRVFAAFVRMIDPDRDRGNADDKGKDDRETLRDMLHTLPKLAELRELRELEQLPELAELAQVKEVVSGVLGNLAEGFKTMSQQRLLEAVTQAEAHGRFGAAREELTAAARSLEGQARALEDQFRAWESQAKGWEHQANEVERQADELRDMAEAVRDEADSLEGEAKDGMFAQAAELERQAESIERQAEVVEAQAEVFTQRAEQFQEAAEAMREAAEAFHSEVLSFERE